MSEAISQCRICGNAQLVDVLDLGRQAFAGIFPRTRAQQLADGPLRLVKCTGEPDVCGLLQLQHTCAFGQVLGERPTPRSSPNSSTVAYHRAMILKLLEHARLPNNALVIDIGANDGTTLRVYPAHRCVLAEFDPTGGYFRDLYPRNAQLIPDFFSAAAVQRYLGGRKASIITSFSILCDLDEPLSFMREVVDVLDEHGICMLEQSYMPTMLRKNAYDTVGHEHLGYYAMRQIKWMTDRVGLKIVDVDINGNRFSLMVAKKSSPCAESSYVAAILDEEARMGLHTLEPYRSFARHVVASRAALRAFFDGAQRAGKTINGLGASKNANILLQYCHVTERDIACIGEVDPDKFEAFTPGTLLPITSEEEILATKPDYLLVLPWELQNRFLAQRRFMGRSLIFPLPQLELVRTSGASRTARAPFSSIQEP